MTISFSTVLLIFWDFKHVSSCSLLGDSGLVWAGQMQVSHRPQRRMCHIWQSLGSRCAAPCHEVPVAGPGPAAPMGGCLSPQKQDFSTPGCFIQHIASVHSSFIQPVTYRNVVADIQKAETFLSSIRPLCALYSTLQQGK